MSVECTVGFDNDHTMCHVSSWIVECPLCHGRCNQFLDRSRSRLAAGHEIDPRYAGATRMAVRTAKLSKRKTDREVRFSCFLFSCFSLLRLLIVRVDVVSSVKGIRNFNLGFHFFAKKLTRGGKGYPKSTATLTFSTRALQLVAWFAAALSLLVALVNTKESFSQYRRTSIHLFHPLTTQHLRLP